MFTAENLIVGLLVGYWWTGLAMFENDSNAHPVDRPSYVDNPLYLRVLSLSIWPIVAKINRELGFYFSCFLGYTVVATIAYAVLMQYLNSYVLVALLLVLRSIPIASVLVNAPAVLIASIVMLPLSVVFGSKMPTTITRKKIKPWKFY